MLGLGLDVEIGLPGCITWEYSMEDLEGPKGSVRGCSMEGLGGVLDGVLQLTLID